MTPIKEILVATDFEPPAAAALEYGRELARRFGARLRLLHVTDDLLMRFVDYPDLRVDLGPVQNNIEQDARTQLDGLLTEADRGELRASGTVVTARRPADAIVRFARDEDVDLIVLGTHGRRALAHLFLGSVAEHVVRSAPCAVLTIGAAVSKAEQEPSAVN